MCERENRFEIILDIELDAHFEISSRTLFLKSDAKERIF